MLVVQRGFSAPGPVWGIVDILEVSTTSSPDEFSWRLHLSYRGGMRKASRESEIM
jgi:hypothetical protein